MKLCEAPMGETRFRCDMKAGHGGQHRAYLDTVDEVVFWGVPLAPKIRIKPSPTADTRTCDFKNVSKETLLASSHQHIRDVHEGLQFFSRKIAEAMLAHDTDKITDIDGFHADFLTGFTATSWWDRHRKLNRHHLTAPDGIPADVNLIDVLDFITDCVMAGMARSGSVYALHLSPGLLELAFQNTVELLKAQIIVEQPEAVAAVDPADGIVTGSPRA